MKQMFVIKYKKEFQQSVSIFLIENQEIDKITEIKRWEGNNYHYLIETRHLLHNNNRSSVLGQKFVLTCVRRVRNSIYQFALVEYSIKRLGNKFNFRQKVPWKIQQVLEAARRFCKNNA